MKLEILKENYLKISAIYTCLIIQYTLTAIIPFALGKAIDGLLNKEYGNLTIFLASRLPGLIASWNSALVIGIVCCCRILTGEYMADGSNMKER